MRILTVAAISAALLGCTATPPTETTATTAAPLVAPLPASELREVTAPERAVLTRVFATGLKDPASAQFKWTKVPKRLSDGSIDYCALVNAAPFIAVITVSQGKITGGAIIAIGDNDRRLPQMCRDKGLDPFAVVVETITTPPARTMPTPTAPPAQTVSTPTAKPKTKLAKAGPCRTPNDRAANGSRCGNRAASVRKGGN